MVAEPVAPVAAEPVDPVAAVPATPPVTFADIKGYVVGTVAAKLRANQTNYVAWSNSIKGEVYAKYRLKVLGDAEKFNEEELTALFTDIKSISEKYV